MRRMLISAVFMAVYLASSMSVNPTKGFPEQDEKNFTEVTTIKVTRCHFTGGTMAIFYMALIWLPLIVFYICKPIIRVCTPRGENTQVHFSSTVKVRYFRPMTPQSETTPQHENPFELQEDPVEALLSHYEDRNMPGPSKAPARGPPEVPLETLEVQTLLVPDPSTQV